MTDKVKHAAATTDSGAAARHDRIVVRELAARVAAIAAQPIQEERRRLWRAFHRRQPVRPLIFVETGTPGWEVLGGELACQTPFLRQYEWELRRKIGILRQIPNLRRIAVSPWADLERSAAAIGVDDCASWRPSPADTVCLGFDADRVRAIIRNGLALFRQHGTPVEINLKDVKTLQGDKARLRRFVEVCREEIEEARAS